MQIEISSTMVTVVMWALAWYLVCHGCGHIVSSWFHITENRRRDRRECREREGWRPWLDSLPSVTVDKEAPK